MAKTAAAREQEATPAKKKQRVKAAKRAAAEAAAEAATAEEAAAAAAEAAAAAATEARRRRKAAKRAAAEAAAEEEEDGAAAAATPSTAKRKKAAATAKKVVEEDDDDGQWSEPEAPPPKKATASNRPRKAAKIASKTAPVAKEDEDEEDEDDDDDPPEFEGDAPPAKSANPAQRTAPAASSKKKVEEDESEDEDDDGHSEGDIPAPAKKPAAPSKAGAAGKKGSDDKEDDSEDSDAELPLKKIEKPTGPGDAGKGKGKGKGKPGKEFEIFVAGLPPSATEKSVRTLFADCGTIVAVNLPLKNDGSHRGKAFIEFDSKKPCDEAVKLHNGGDFDGSTLTVRMSSDWGDAGGAFVKQTEKWKKDNEVCVAGLPFSMSEENVKAHFEKYGKIVGFRMPPDAAGKHRGIAFVCFSSPEPCQKVVELHGTSLNGRKLFAYMSGDKAACALSRKEKAAPSRGGGTSTKDFEMFLGGLPFSATEDVLWKDFSECGELVSLRMVKNAEGNCKGSAFVEYKDKESCEAALKFDGTEYGGRTLRVRYSSDESGKGGGKDGKGKSGGKGKSKSGKGKPPAGSKDLEVMVTGLPFAANSEKLREDFAECGEIRRLVLPLNDDGNAKGNAYIEFASKEACDKALEYNDTEYGGRWIRVRMSADREGSAEAKAKAKSKAETGSKQTGKITFDSDDE